jgi:hypothetical protein
LKKGLIALVAVGAVALVGAAQAGAGLEGGTDIYAPKDCTKPKVEPKRITLACADDGIMLKRLGWDEWNTEKVKGQGKLLVNDCDPNCAAGSIDKYAVKVKLLNPQTYTCGSQTVTMYRRAHVRFKGAAPDNQNDYRSFKLVCDS